MGRTYVLSLALSPTEPTLSYRHSFPQPCGYCTRGNKVCAFTKIDKRRRRTTHSPSFATEPPRNPPPLPPSTSTNSAAATSTERSRDCDADYNAVAGPSGTYTSYEAPLTTSAPPREEHHDQEILASLVQAIGVEAPDHASPPTTDSANPIEGIHRHLKKVFSMRSVVDDEQEHLLERDEDLASFFLPSEEEGMSYITCFFAHVRRTAMLRSSRIVYSLVQADTHVLTHPQAASTYRYLDESEMTGLAHRFFAREPDVLADPLSSALVLVVMAVGYVPFLTSRTSFDSYEPPAAASGRRRGPERILERKLPKPSSSTSPRNVESRRPQWSRRDLSACICILRPCVHSLHPLDRTP